MQTGKTGRSDVQVRLGHPVVDGPSLAFAFWLEFRALFDEKVPSNIAVATKVRTTSKVTNNFIFQRGGSFD